MKKAILRLCAFLLLVGVMAGPVYHVYCLYFSGKKVAEKVLFSQELKRIEFDRLKHAEMEHCKAASVDVELSPEMNPVALVMKGKYVKPRSRTSSRYSLSLSRAGKRVWETSFSVSSEGEKMNKKDRALSIGKLGLVSFSSIAGTIQVPEKGTYTFALKLESAALKISDMSLLVREKVIVPKRAIYLPGYICIAVSLLVSILLADKKKKTKG